MIEFRLLFTRSSLLCKFYYFQVLNLLRLTRFSRGKIRFGRFSLCKRFDISQLCLFRPCLKLPPYELMMWQQVQVCVYLVRLPYPLYFCLGKLTSMYILHLPSSSQHCLQITPSSYQPYDGILYDGMIIIRITRILMFAFTLMQQAHQVGSNSAPLSPISS